MRIPFQIRVLEQASDGVPHGVHVLARNIGLVWGVRDIILDRVRMGVHAGFYVGDVVVLAIPGDSLVVDRADGVELVGAAVHASKHLASVGFVAQGPDEDRRVVVVAVDHRFDAVDARAFPFHARSGDRGFRRCDVAGGVPRAVGLQIGFVDEVDAVAVGERVETPVVGVVASADGVDVVALAKDDVVDHLLLREGASLVTVKLVPVHALEDDSLPVESHDSVLDGESAESYALGNGLDGVGDGFARRRRGVRGGAPPGQRQRERVQGRVFGRPRPDPRKFARGHSGAALLPRRRLPYDCAGVVREDRPNVALLLRFGDCGVDVERTGPGQVVVIGVHAQIVEVRARFAGQNDVAEKAVETPRVLVLKPRGARVFEAGDGQNVVRGRRVDVGALPPEQNAGDVELARGVAVFGVSHEGAVEPHVYGRRKSLKDNRDVAAVRGFGEGGAQSELPAVEGRVVESGDLRRPGVLVPVPGHLNVDVGGAPSPFGFQGRGDVDGSEVRRFRVGFREFRVLDVDFARQDGAELPGAGQALGRRVRYVVRVGKQAIDGENRRVF